MFTGNIFGFVKENNLRSLLIIFFLLLSLFATIYLASQKQLFKKKAAELTVQLEKRPPEYAEGEIIVKFKPDTKISIKQGKDIDKETVNFNDLNQESIPNSLKTLDEKFKIEKIEKVFKGAEEPAKELTKFKQNFSQDISEGKRKINEEELLKIDLSRTYKISFSKKISVQNIIQSFYSNKINEIEYIQPNYIYRTSSLPNDPYFLDHYPDQTGGRDPDWNPSYDYQWNLKKIKIAEAWNMTGQDFETAVAIVDTGVDYTHSELGGCTLTQLNQNLCEKVTPGFNFVGSNNNPLDDHGHGTGLAGVISAISNNNQGIACMSKKVRIMPVKGLAQDGAGYDDVLTQAVRWAVDNGADVINMSWGNSEPFPSMSPTLKSVLDYAYFHNVILVAAAGNSNDDVGKGYWPANYQYVISVAASDENSQRAFYSNYGKVEVIAPGGNVPYNLLMLNAHDPLNPSQYLNLGDLPVGTGYIRLAGTSMATPHVAGLAGILLSTRTNLNPDEIKTLIEYFADEIGTAGNNKNFGWGMINVSAALQAVIDNNIPPAAEIYSPSRNVRVSGIFEIKGKTAVTNFQNYTLQVGLGENPQSWSSEGIILSNNGSTPVDNNILGTIDTTSYVGNWITIKLEVTNQGNIKKQDYVYVYVPKDNFNYTLGENKVVSDEIGDSLNPSGKYTDRYYTVWTDFRNTVNTGWPDTFFSLSSDEGNSFSTNIQVSDSSSEFDTYTPNIEVVSNAIYTIFSSSKEKIDFLSAPYSSDQRIVVKKSIDQGNTFQLANMLIIPDLVYPRGGGLMEIRTASFGNYLYITWQSGYKQNDNVDIYFTRFNVQTNAFEETKKIQTITYTSDMLNPYPSLVTDTEGTVYLAWTERIPNQQYNVYLIKSTNSGTSFSIARELFDTNKYFNPVLPRLGIDSNKQTILLSFAAQTPQSPYRDVWITKSIDKANTFSEPVNISAGVFQNAFYSSYLPAPITSNQAGIIVVAFRDVGFGEVYLRIIDSSLNKMSDPILVSPIETSLGFTPSLVTDPTGNNIFVLYSFYDPATSKSKIYSRLLSFITQIISPTTFPSNPPIPSSIYPPLPNPQNCPRITSTFSTYYGHAYINGQPAASGTKVWAVNPRGQIVGCQETGSSGIIPLFYIYGEDHIVDPPLPGMRDGERITMYVNTSLATSNPSSLIWHSDWNNHIIDLYASPQNPTLTPSRTPTPSPTPLIPTPSETPNPNFGKMVQFRPPGITTCSYILIPPNPQLIMGENYTIEFFFRPHEDILNPGIAGSGLYSLISKEGLFGGGWGAYNIFIKQLRLLAEIFHLSKTDGFVDGQAITTNPNLLQNQTWYFFKLVKQGNTINQYLNNNLVGTTTFNYGDILTEKNPYPTYIGNWKPFNSTGCFSGYKGEIDELRISNIARAIEPISSLPFTKDANTVALYHFDGNANETTNSSLNGIESGVEYLSYPQSTVFMSSWLTPTITPTVVPSATPTPTPVCPKGCPKVTSKIVGKEVDNKCWFQLDWNDTRNATGYRVYVNGIIKKQPSVSELLLRSQPCAATRFIIEPKTTVSGCPRVDCSKSEFTCTLPYAYPGSCR